MSCDCHMLANHPREGERLISNSHGRRSLSIRMSNPYNSTKKEIAVNHFVP